MPQHLSAGILLFRENDHNQLEVLIVHPGGPYWASKDAGAWSIPKGEYASGDEPFAAAEREFNEEVGLALPSSEPLSLGYIRQHGGKRVTAWAVRGDVDVNRASSNNFEMEWPPGSGRTRSFPEVDRVGWFGIDEARGKLLKAQALFLDRLVEVLSGHSDGGVTSRP
ncbi:MAG: NUDIX domain-containing protein [Acidimicrobiales bacterium]